jgi:hypothetical protein
MAEPDKRPVTMEELLVSSLALTDALAKLLIEKGLIPEKSLCRRFQRNGRPIKDFSILRSNEHRKRSAFLETVASGRLNRRTTREAESVKGMAMKAKKKPK